MDKKQTYIEIMKQIKTLQDKLADILSEEEMAYDNMPEGLQCSRNGQISEQSQRIMDDALDFLMEADTMLQEEVDANE